MKNRSFEETLERVARVSKLGDKVVSITRRPTKAQKKRLLLAFFEGMEKNLQK
jgi:hypothetical protein